MAEAQNRSQRGTTETALDWYWLGTRVMPYGTDLECGEELNNDIATGLIAEEHLTATGRRKLEAYRAAPFFHVETFSEFDARTRLSLDIETGSDADLEFLGFAVDKPQDS